MDSSSNRGAQIILRMEKDMIPPGERDRNVTSCSLNHELENQRFCSSSCSDKGTESPEGLVSPPCLTRINSFSWKLDYE
ncbi:hypothetical protein BTVI_09097 [Pitangus sulphuratus]|nr:hypothetical protein BTVI_09097 [Pitangus sulphuratus]